MNDTEEVYPSTAALNLPLNNDRQNRKVADAAGKSTVNFIIGISGCSSAGKTTLSLLLEVVLRYALRRMPPVSELPDITVIHQDTYFLQHLPHPPVTTIRPHWPEDRLVAQMTGPDNPPAILVEDRDCVSCCDVELLARHIEEPGARPERYRVPAPDVAPATPEAALRSLEPGTLEKAVERLKGAIKSGDDVSASAIACRVTIVEGFTLLARDPDLESTGAGSEARNLRALRSLQERLDVALFLPVDRDEARARRFVRRKYRDTPEGDRKPGEYWKCGAYFDQVAWPHYERYHRHILSNLAEAEAYARDKAEQQGKGEREKHVWEQDLCISGVYVRPPDVTSVDDTLLWAVGIVGAALATRLLEL
ncbi:hypothetical protein GGS26DRAFT_547708 [Hypomontagnella submonticulosa]|nr:hypothetical protein GGS26DRAFT_547708 [Hypomontagnella submonticulosa]